MPEHISTLVQIAGSLLILVPFVLVQLKRTRPETLSDIWRNVAGSTALPFDAGHGRQWGFSLLEGMWAVVFCMSLVRRSADPPIDRSIRRCRCRRGSVRPSA